MRSVGMSDSTSNLPAAPGFHIPYMPSKLDLAPRDVNELAVALSASVR